MRIRKKENKTLKSKGSYRGDFYFPIDYQDYLDNGFETLVHELGHVKLTEQSYHGIAYFEIMQLIHENYFNSKLPDILKLLQNAAEYTEETYAIFEQIYYKSTDSKHFLKIYEEFKVTEYYRRYRLHKFEKIIKCNVDIEKKMQLIENILFTAMNTYIFQINCDWCDKKSLIEQFKKKPNELHPDKRLVKLLNWVNSHLSEPSIFDITEEQLHKNALGEEKLPLSEYELFFASLQASIDKNNLIKKERRKSIEFTPDANGFEQRFFFVFSEEVYTYYKIFLPDKLLFSCDLLEYFAFDHIESATLTSFIKKEKYQLSMPSCNIMANLINHFSGLIIAYLEDYDTLNMLLDMKNNNKIIYKSIYNIIHLKKCISALHVSIKKIGIIKYDSNVGIPYLIDEYGRCFTGNATLISIIYGSGQPIDCVIEPETIIPSYGICGKNLIKILTTDIHFDNNVPYIACFNGTLSQKSFLNNSEDDMHAIAAYYFNVFRDAILYQIWKDAQRILNYVMNLLSNLDDKICALEEMDNILTHCKSQMILKICGDEKVLQGFIDIYTIILQYSEIYCGTISQFTSITLNNMANLYVQCEKYKNAYTLAILALEIKKIIYDENVKETARGHYLVGVILLKSGQYEEGVKKLIIAKQIAEKCRDSQLIRLIDNFFDKY